jgi:hypothetical protein
MSSLLISPHSVHTITHNLWPVELLFLVTHIHPFKGHKSCPRCVMMSRGVVDTPQLLSAIHGQPSAISACVCVCVCVCFSGGGGFRFT